MTALLLAAAAVLLVSIVVGLLFVTRSRAGAEALLAALLLSSTGVALVLVLSRALVIPRGVDVALVLALLASVLGVGFVMRGWSPAGSEERQ